MSNCCFRFVLQDLSRSVSFNSCVKVVGAFFCRLCRFRTIHTVQLGCAGRKTLSLKRLDTRSWSFAAVEMKLCYSLKEKKKRKINSREMSAMQPEPSGKKQVADRVEGRKTDTGSVLLVALQGFFLFLFFYSSCIFCSMICFHQIISLIIQIVCLCKNPAH